jgi:hypothetical protein
MDATAKLASRAADREDIVEECETVLGNLLFVYSPIVEGWMERWTPSMYSASQRQQANGIPFSVDRRFACQTIVRLSRVSGSIGTIRLNHVLGVTGVGNPLTRTC